MNKLYKKDSRKTILPNLTTMESERLETSPIQRPVTTGITISNKRISFKTPYKVTEDDNIYKLSEIKKLKSDRKIQIVPVTDITRMWDVYPKKQNLLQDVRRQYSAFLNTKKVPKLNNETVIEPKENKSKLPQE